MNAPALLIFIKNPEKGKVKTRLARDLGDDKALQIYRALLAHTREVALSVSAERFLFYSEYVPESDDWPASGFDKRLQKGADLGERMYRAFVQVLERHERAVIIGSDCPQLQASIVEEAFARLEEFPVVLGPAEDGGYYLLGLHRPEPSLFHDISWSTESVLEQTLQRVAALGQEAFLLPRLSDVDRAADWERYGWELE